MDLMRLLTKEINRHVFYKVADQFEHQGIPIVQNKLHRTKTHTFTALGRFKYILGLYHLLKHYITLATLSTTSELPLSLSVASRTGGGFATTFARDFSRAVRNPNHIPEHIQALAHENIAQIDSKKRKK